MANIYVQYKQVFSCVYNILLLILPKQITEESVSQLLLLGGLTSIKFYPGKYLSRKRNTAWIWDFKGFCIPSGNLNYHFRKWDWLIRMLHVSAVCNRGHYQKTTFLLSFQTYADVCICLGSEIWEIYFHITQVPHIKFRAIWAFTANWKSI